MRVTRDESPKNEKYLIREKGEAFDQFYALSHSVRAPPPSVRPSVNPIQLGANSPDKTCIHTAADASLYYYYYCYHAI